MWAQDPTCSKLAPTCNEYVASNPGAFAEAYWLINSVKVYSKESVAGKRARSVRRFIS